GGNARAHEPEWRRQQIEEIDGKALMQQRTREVEAGRAGTDDGGPKGCWRVRVGHHRNRSSPHECCRPPSGGNLPGKRRRTALRAARILRRKDVSPTSDSCKGWAAPKNGCTRCRWVKSRSWSW